MKLFRVEYMTKTGGRKSAKIQAKSHIEAERFISDSSDFSMPFDIEMLEWDGHFKMAA